MIPGDWNWPGVERGIERRGSPEDEYKFQVVRHSDKELLTALALYQYDFGARYYDPQLGRWHTPDPADQFASPYSAMGNNPVMLTDPDGRFVPLLVFAGAFMGGLNVALRGGTGGQFLKGVFAGGLSSAAGGFAASLAPAGILPGLAYGAGTGALIGAGHAALTGGNIGQGAMWGGITGGVLGGVSGGLAAAKYGANIWTGKLPVNDFTSASGAIAAEGSPVNYDDASLSAFAKKQFGNNMRGLNKLTMQKMPKSYKVNADGSWTNPAGKEF